MRTRLEPFYSSTGRPSVDPELMIRTLIADCCFGVRSSSPRPLAFYDAVVRQLGRREAR